jgi:hypothetical protein
MNPPTRATIPASQEARATINDKFFESAGELDEKFSFFLSQRLFIACLYYNSVILKVI